MDLSNHDNFMKWYGWYKGLKLKGKIIFWLIISIFFAIVVIHYNGLKKELVNLQSRLKEKDSQIQLLETQLAPFKTVALQYYPGNESEALRKLAVRINDVEERVEGIYKYANVANLDADGFKIRCGKHLNCDTDLTILLEKTYELKEDGKIFFKYGDEEAKIYREVISKFPEFPFPYIFLAEYLYRNNDSDWEIYLNKGIEILEVTTKIKGHKPSHDEMLDVARKLLKKMKTEK